MRIYLPVRLPALNVYLRMHWAERSRLHASLAKRLMVTLGGTKEPRKVKRRVAVCILHPKDFDPDNLVGTVKPLIDALRRVGLVYEDSPQWIELSVEQKRHDTYGVMITVEDA